MASRIKESLQAARCRLQQTARDGETQQTRLEHDPEKCEAFSETIILNQQSKAR
jgi:hypothetical protein